MAGIFLLIRTWVGMMKHNVALIVALLAVVATGCRDTDNGDDGGDGGGADSGTGDDISIYDVRTGSVQVGGAVTLRGVVVTAIDARGNNTGDFWVAEPDEHPTHGRAFGGILVFGANVSDVANISVGDLIDIEGGVLDEFAFNCPECQAPLETLAELKPADGGALTLTKVGTAAVPAPVTVSATDIGGSLEEADKWESVAITVENVAATSNPREISGDSTRLDFGITGPIAVQSSLGSDLSGVTRDDCFASISGIGNYFFEFKILPRDDADVVAAADTTGCLYETEAGDCDDGTDNDFDGFADCEDFSCSTANPDLCSIATTIVDIQNGTVAENSLVILSGVVVTAISTNGQSLWVQDEGSSADFSGIKVFRGSSAPALDGQIVVGARVDITGTTDEFTIGSDTTGSEETQVRVDASTNDVTFVSAGATVAVRNDLTTTALADATGGEAYEGLLVELTNVAVVTGDAGFGEFTVGPGEFHVDEFLFSYAQPADGTCFATLRGVVTENFGNYKLLPRDAGDMVTGGTCE